MTRVWLPISYDALEMFKINHQRPAWLENNSMGAWLKTAGLGALVFILGIGGGYFIGLVPATPRDWIPPLAAEELLKYFMISITIIVVAVPEGLAMSVTLSLAYSMRKMTAANNLVRQMHACETIGAATVICSDKTGTLTQNEMQVFETRFPSLQDNKLTASLSSVNEQLLAEAIAANTTAQLSEENNVIKPLGNPTEGALLLWLNQQSIDYQQHRGTFTISHQWTFTTERKYMATMGQSVPLGSQTLYVKGAPEIIMSQCVNMLTADGETPLEPFKQEIEQALKDYQRRGMRTLAIAYRNAANDDPEATIESLTHDMIWLGFVAIEDPVRPEVPNAVADCYKAGIHVKIVTGDIVETAKEISRQIGLSKPDDGPECFLTGAEFGKMNDEQAKVAVQKLKVLARARPLDKLRLVKLLQSQNHVVAVTGDGTNDAPALNHADVGLAMGKTGTAVAKEASDIILLDDSFKSIVNAVMWGRSLYENIQRFIFFQLTINVVALGIAMLGPFIGIKLPLTVIQMLWVNLIMDTFASLALATEPPHESVMNRHPRNPLDFIVTPHMMREIGGIGLVFLAGLIGLLFYFQGDGLVTNYELSLFFTIFVMLQFWNLFNARSLGQTDSALKGIFENKGFTMIALGIFIGQVLIVQFGGEVFRTVPLSLETWALVVAGTSLVLWIGEIKRFVLRRQA
ncbi:MAG: calcium-translocating P-type ATPase, PMCA-type, partial [SAR324 cluster bacterium]|nr:calcium-translocating P-type ATPase, PMCA-type [SAR324 cluster bacterium]